MMSRPLDVLFLCDFSELSFRSIPAVTQLASQTGLRLTLMHVVEKRGGEQAQRNLQSFFPEANRFGDTRRLIRQGELVAVAKAYCADNRPDLIVAPASSGFGLPRPGRRSSRVRLLEQCQVPLWTMGRRSTPPSNLKNIACWVDLRQVQAPHVLAAIEWSKRLGAQLHLLAALPELRPSVVVRQDVPLNHDAVASTVRLQVDGLIARPRVHVADFDTPGLRRKSVRDCEAALVFLPQPKHTLTQWLGIRPQCLDAFDCPTLLIPDSAPTLPEPLPVQTEALDAYRVA